LAASVVATSRAQTPSPPSPSNRPAAVYHSLPTLVPDAPVERAGLRLDLYLPAKTDRTPPLLVFMLGGLWSMPDDNYAIGPALGDEMQREGVAVAIVRFALADGYKFDRCARDLALLVARLADRHAEFGFDGRRIILGGHGPGAVLASMLGIHSRYFADAAFDRSRIAGVVAQRGVYDLSDAAMADHPLRTFYQWGAGATADERRAISLIEHATAAAPRFLLLAGGSDLAGFAQDARAMARALERAGHRDTQSYIVPDRDGRTLANFSGAGNHLTSLVTAFIRGDAVPEPIEGSWAVKQIWQRQPPLSSEPFWADERVVKSHPVTDRFKSMMPRVFDQQIAELGAYPGKVYHAIDLDAWLTAQEAARIGRGEFLTITNVRGERLFLSRTDIAAARPQVVVGLDDERNLFRLAVWYRLKNQYSWRPEKAPLPKMIRPVGAFLYFPEDPPPGARNGTGAAFGLTIDSFRLTTTDPLARVRDVPAEVAPVLMGEVGCLTCHSFRSAGARSFHVKAEDAKPHGGCAFALEEYPADVWRRFLYDQKAVAETIGVNPLVVAEPAATLLHNLVAAERRPGPPSLRCLGP
jgi:acetyl esterase/lipase